MTIFAGIPVGTFTQSVSSTTWTILHNFGMPVNIDVSVLLSGEIQKIMPLDVKMSEDMNTTTVTFTFPCTGSARVVGLRNVPAANQSPPDDDL